MKDFLLTHVFKKKVLLSFSLFFLFSTLAFAQPSRDNCSGATSLTSGTSCSITAANLANATASVGIPAGCTAGTHYDIWYKFTAASTSQTVTISNRQNNFSNPEVQIFSGACGSLTSIACGATSATATAVAIGNVYYVRISNVGTAVSTQAKFDICVTHPQPPAANDDCTAATLLTSAATCNSVTGNLRYATSAGPAGACGGATATNTYDVWYRFLATATTHTVTLSNLGANLAATSTYIEMLSGSCGSLTSLGCQTAAARQTIGSLTIGTFYYVRVYVLLSPVATTTAAWDFDICIQQPPANDDCAGAIALTSGATCTNSAGSLDLATLNAAIPLGCFAAGNYYDVWYKFVASAISHTVTLSSLGSNFSAPRIQIYSGNCGTLVSLSCASATTISQAALVIGVTYYVRIANFNASASGLGTVANFNICVTTAAAPPANDLCSGAFLLTSSTTCSNVAGTLIKATATAGIASCGNNGSSEVWYKFVAKTNYPTITLSSMGTLFSGASPLIQLFSGNCGALAQVTGGCTPTPLNVAALGGAGLTVGNTYYVRITTNTSMSPPATGTWGFNICITDPVGSAIDYGKSYVNLTDITVGGTIDPGDVLEIRATLVVNRAGSPLVTKAIDSIAFFDTLSAARGFSYVPGSLALRTNEGKLYRSYTDAFDIADAGWYKTAGPGTDTMIQMNMGLGATYAARGKLRSSSRPSNFGNSCIIMATYRVTVTAAFGTKIKYGGGGFSYRDTASGIFYTINFPSDSLIVYGSPGSCPDAISPTNVIGDEVNGTFGAPVVSAGSQNRGTSPNTNYGYKTFSANAPDDYYYGVANNTSAANTTNQLVGKGNAARVFTVWDITGDHTGAANTGNTSKGNLPCNPSLPISTTNPCGYMLVINSAYKTDVAFEFNVNGACSETYYEISAWFKNICYKCGCDSTGTGSGGGSYIPTAAGDSSGIKPNIAFQINGTDYYTTGNLDYKGLFGTQSGSDTLNKWVKRTFVYKTGPNETKFAMTFRNNAPGGGGNDWALDDISLRTCYPNMIYSPSSNPSVCEGKALIISDTVRSYYNVYIYFMWQRSTDGGVSWIDLPGTSGVASTTWNGSAYEYVDTYAIPVTATTTANNNDQYRMVVATTAANLVGGCNYSDISPVTLSVVTTCIDIDDDNDGIPDYVELNNPVALQDANLNGIPNWNDASYPGFIDNNTDGVNDNFDPSADSDNDGIPNFMDANFAGFIDSNGDLVNDNMDKDLDGIPNHLDLDSDNDGIPDTVESYGVDENGDGVIDNYSSSDADGFSQNVDASAGGVAGSGNGLGAQDFDNDGIPNYLDTDSDNDGIPDIIEALGTDADNDGHVDVFIDDDADGLSDNLDSDIFNDLIAENPSISLLRTGADIDGDGRADSYPFKNMDYQTKPNPYDLDSDMDGIVDVREAGFADIDFNGFVDGPYGLDGWNIAINSQASLGLRNSDGTAGPDYLDIDSDDDGIPDNIEGQTTAGYKFPLYQDNTDGVNKQDGIDNQYDNFAGIGGSGIIPADKDGDTIPDYLDLDTDSDGILDIVEGNDFNLNGIYDDNVTLTNLDADGDGLDNKFDSLNSVTNIRGTSYRMGTSGSLVGDPAPGGRTPVQKFTAAQTEREWRYVSYVLPLQHLQFSGQQNLNIVTLNWSLITPLLLDKFEIQRSTDNIHFKTIITQAATIPLNVLKSFAANDDIIDLTCTLVFYRLKVIAHNGEEKYSEVIVVKKGGSNNNMSIQPNPAQDNVTLNFYADKENIGSVIIKDFAGRQVMLQKHKLLKGSNSIPITGLSVYSNGVYTVQVIINNDVITQKLVIDN